MKNFFSYIYNNRWYILFLIVFTGLGLYFTLEQLNNRRHIDSASAEVYEEVVEVGSEGYGYVTEIYFNEGEEVRAGDVLYTYLSQDLEEKLTQIEHNDEASTEVLTALTEAKQFSVKSPINGVVYQVGVTLNSYVTKDDIAFMIQTSDSLIDAKLEVSPNRIQNIHLQSPVTVGLPDGRIVNGHIKTIYPEYDSATETLQVLIELEDPSIKLTKGMQVIARVRVEDQLADTIFNSLAGTPVKLLAQGMF